MDFDEFVEQLGLQDEENGPDATPTPTTEAGWGGDVLTAARHLGSSAATIVKGNGTTRQGIGALALDWAGCVATLHRASLSVEDRCEHLRALGTLAQVQAHGDPMREAGVVTVVTECLCHADPRVNIAAAEALRHLACANQNNRIAGREAGAIPHLVRMLTYVADEDHQTGGEEGGEGGAECRMLLVDTVTAATAALRNLSFQNGANRDLIRFSGGLEPLLRIVAVGTPPRPPPAGTARRHAAFKAAGALENLAADNEGNAIAIVRAGVVPAMRELLIGHGDVPLTQRAARKGREALFALISLDKREAAERRARSEAAEAAAAARTVQAKALVLQHLREGRPPSERRGTDDDDEVEDQQQQPTKAESERRLRLVVSLGMLESELGGYTRDDEWARAVAEFARDRARHGNHATAAAATPPLSIVVTDKTTRALIYTALRRPALDELISVASRPAPGGGAGAMELCVGAPPTSQAS